MQQRGKLKSWKDTKGFGFIAPEKGGEDVFVHISAFDASRRPQVGDELSFSLTRDDKGKLRAEQVTLLNDERPSSSFMTTNLLFLLACLLPALGAFSFARNGEFGPLAFYVIPSLLCILAYAYDKRAAQKGVQRIPEKTLHLLEFFGGWPGAWFAQQEFRHKTRKSSYQMIFWGIVVLHQLFWADYLLLGGRIINRFLMPLVG